MKLSVKILLFLAMLIVQTDDSLAGEVSTTTINTEALSVKNQNLSEASIGRKYALTGDYPVYLRSGRSEYDQIYRNIPEYSVLLVLDEQEKWSLVRFFDKGKQFEGWIPNSNFMLFVEGYDGDIKLGAREIRRRISKQEEKRRMQRVDALKTKKREISDLDYKGKSDVCEELSRFDIIYQHEADIYKGKITVLGMQPKAVQEEHAKAVQEAKAKQQKQEEQAKLERIKRANELIGAKVYMLNLDDFRTEPMWEGEHIFIAGCGTVFTVIAVEEDGNWYRVKALNGKVGYIAADWVTTDADIVKKKKAEENRLKEQEEQAKKAEEKRLKEQEEQAKKAEEKSAKEQKKRRDKALQEWHAKIDSLPDSDYIKTVVRNRKICLGMSDKAALLSWGKPDDINRSVGSWGKHEQWVYGSNYLYFENGKLTSWQD